MAPEKSEKSEKETPAAETASAPQQAIDSSTVASGTHAPEATVTPDERAPEARAEATDGATPTADAVAATTGEIGKTKDAVDKSAAMQQAMTQVQKETGGRPRAVDGGEEPVVIRAGQDHAEVPTEVFGNTEQLVTVGADVWAEVWPEGTKRPSHVLLFHKGQKVPSSQLKRAVDERRGVQMPTDLPTATTGGLTV